MFTRVDPKLGSAIYEALQNYKPMGDCLNL